ncbi:MAG: hypothetical protein JW976_00670 [Syntrophaceae bacterium]|nr:hypothetical protein [Syntrophaceae bacterium]
MNLLKLKVIALVVALLTTALSIGIALAGPERYLKNGYIQNDKGEKCWYTQVVKENNTYFHGSLKGTNGIITFDNPMCMSDSGLGLDVNKMMINNIISRWYSHSDADFQTRVSEMYNGSMLQKKGKCIQSKKYPLVGITVDYFIKGNSITGVIHGSSVQGCTN